jgi:hypothetical protein
MKRLARLALLAALVAHTACGDLTGLADAIPRMCGVTYAGSGCGYEWPAFGNGPLDSLLVSAPDRVVGTATYDPELLWGTRCEFDVTWSVGPMWSTGTIQWVPGSTISWYQINADGRTGPFTAEWDPAEFFGAATLPIGQSGKVAAVWVRGNDRSHPDSPPFWDATITVKYRNSNPLTSTVVRTTTFGISCAAS